MDQKNIRNAKAEEEKVDPLGNPMIEECNQPSESVTSQAADGI